MFIHTKDESAGNTGVLCIETESARINASGVTTLVIAFALLVGCEKQYKVDDGYVPEVCELDVTESKKSEFFELNKKYELSKTDILKIEKLLSDSRAKGIDNTSFAIIVDRPIENNIKDKIRNKVLSIAYKAGFINSRVIYSGTAVCDGAQSGVRVDVLEYDVKEVDCSPWSEYIGDMDTNKNLPKFGVADKYNLREMIANDADLVVPRKYKGPVTKAATDAMSSSVSTSGGTSTQKL
ncbi:hypothetical protein FACS189449_04720 [Alphaproteobacteria bacterium]|nr:hypothetical protein FACS189449_04720 [Alphaproteobacteria bacterium]